MNLLDIHVVLTYNAIAPFIGLEPTNHHTVSAKCPYCSSYAWSIYQDTKNMEEWHYCYHCKANGTILSMAAERLDMSLSEGIRYLGSVLNLPIKDDELDTYHKSINLANTYAKFWDDSQNSMRALSADQRRLIYALKWHNTNPMSVDRFMSGPGRLFGMSHRSRTLESTGMKFPPQDPHVAIVPFYKSPSQLSAFMGVTLNRENFCGSGDKGRRTFDRGEHGFAGMQFLPESKSSVVVATSMVSNMIQMHMHNFNTSDVPLPLLGWHQPAVPRKQKQWLSLSNKEVILWEKYPTAMMIQQAIMLNAKLSFVGPEMFGETKAVKGENWYRWIHHDPASDILQRIITNAKPFNYAIKNWARSAQTQEKTRLLEDASRFNGEVADFVRSTVEPKLQLSIPRSISAPIKNQFNALNAIGHTLIIEKNGKWYGPKNNVRFPGIIRVTQIVVRPKNVKEYIGYVIVDDKKLDFHVPKNKARMSWFFDFILQNGIFRQIEPLNSIFNSAKDDSFDPVDVACRFEYPEVVLGLDRIGWDGTGFQFKLAKVEQGKVIPCKPYLFENAAPGPETAEYFMETYMREAFSRDIPNTYVIWALTVALAAQITSCVVGLDPRGVCILRNKIEPFFALLLHKMSIKPGPTTQWTHLWPRHIANIKMAKNKAEDNYFVTEGTPDQSLHYSIMLDACDLEIESRQISQNVDKLILNYLREFTATEPPKVQNYKEWLQYTIKVMKAAFPFISPELIDKSVSRLSIV